MMFTCLTVESTVVIFILQTVLRRYIRMCRRVGVISRCSKADNHGRKSVLEQRGPPQNGQQRKRRPMRRRGEEKERQKKT